MLGGYVQRVLIEKGKEINYNYGLKSLSGFIDNLERAILPKYVIF